jgi:hypothetical protein
VILLTFKEHYLTDVLHDVPQILQEFYEANFERWSEERPKAKEETASAFTNLAAQEIATCGCNSST